MIHVFRICGTYSSSQTLLNSSTRAFVEQFNEGICTKVCLQHISLIRTFPFLSSTACTSAANSCSGLSCCVECSVALLLSFLCTPVQTRSWIVDCFVLKDGTTNDQIRGYQTVLICFSHIHFAIPWMVRIINFQTLAFMSPMTIRIPYPGVLSISIHFHIFCLFGWCITPHDGGHYNDLG